MFELSDDIRKLFDGPNVAHVATLLPDGAPHSAPMWADLDRGRIAIMTSLGSRKGRNLTRDPRVGISILDHTNPFVSAYVRGRVVEVVTGDAGWAIVDRLSNKYLGMDYGRDQDRVAMLIEPEHASFFNPGA